MKVILKKEFAEKLDMNLFNCNRWEIILNDEIKNGERHYNNFALIHKIEDLVNKYYSYLNEIYSCIRNIKKSDKDSEKIYYFFEYFNIILEDEDYRYLSKIGKENKEYDSLIVKEYKIDENQKNKYNGYKMNTSAMYISKQEDDKYLGLSEFIEKQNGNIIRFVGETINTKYNSGILSLTGNYVSRNRDIIDEYDIPDTSLETKYPRVISNIDERTLIDRYNKIIYNMVLKSIKEYNYSNVLKVIKGEYKPIISNINNNLKKLKLLQEEVLNRYIESFTSQNLKIDNITQTITKNNRKYNGIR